MLMGKEEQARAEYAKAIAAASAVGDRLNWELQSGLRVSMPTSIEMPT